MTLDATLTINELKKARRLQTQESKNNPHINDKDILYWEKEVHKKVSNGEVTLEQVKEQLGETP